MKIDFFYCKFKAIKYVRILVFLLLSTLFACGTARHLEDDEKLLTKVKIATKAEKKYVEELKSISKQKPNRKLLGVFKIYLGIYNLYYHKEKSIIKEKLGEAPVIYDSLLSVPSADLMSRFLNNKGYYENEVSFSHKLTKKRAKVTYHVNKGPRYEIDQLAYNIEDQDIKKIVETDNNNAVLNIGAPFDLSELKKERNRLERLLKNNGYYQFSKEYVVFEVDTSSIKNSASILILIKNPTVPYLNTDSLVEKKHEKYTISKVIVRMDYTNRNIDLLSGDTTLVDSMYFVDLKADKFNKKAISRITYIRPGKLYKLNVQEQTYRNLSALRVFSYVSIQYEQDYQLGGQNLVAYIDLNPRKQKSLTLETEGTNNGGNLGMNGTVTFQNNNTFKGAEILNVSVNGGVEAQQILTDEEEEQIIDGFLPFNTFEFGPEVSLEVPRFLLPISSEKFSPKGNPRTTFNASYNFQERPDYKRNVTKTFIAYTWNESPTKTHVIQPFDLSYINLEPSKEFQEVLQSIQNPFLINSYRDNLILALKYSFIFNNKTSNKLKNYIFFRGNFESAGNLLSLVSDSWNTNRNEDNSYNIAGIRYAQYLKTDVDFRFYQRFNFNQLVYRFTAGIGIPYGNSLAMPFEKSFYGGGANGIRAWRARELGPGNLADSVEKSIDQIGNMNLETNLEFRFPITNIIEGAAFVDAGNIWNVIQETNQEVTEFKLRRLWRGTAIGIGSGIRLNFSFFIIRLDVATKLKDPSLSKPNQLKPQWSKSNLNLGIGYPF